MIIKVKNFNMRQIAESGECFRWKKTGEDEYVGVIFGKVCYVSQKENVVTYDGVSESEFMWYFDLERDYEKIWRYYSNDLVLQEAIRCGSGIRILNQDKFETLISFIISANNNIPRIKKSVESLARMFGKHIYG
ncbi:MAG: 8-oxoguanine DNA glycosylase, N-terminal domain-containing protein [Clostridia bacterium]|nr:8-oxoguanine DNA glycosylase, N-terminal domain-containing protein [Clostridia bacterium]